MVFLTISLRKTVMSHSLTKLVTHVDVACSKLGRLISKILLYVFLLCCAVFLHHYIQIKLTAQRKYYLSVILLIFSKEAQETLSEYFSTILGSHLQKNADVHEPLN